MGDFKEETRDYRELFEEALCCYFRTAGVPEELVEAMAYSLFAGGKRLRPVLVLEVTDALGGRLENALPAACAIEMVHTYSLIHDDLPSMDDDDLRRGRPSSHRAFGEGVAILAGDALLTMAFETAASTPPEADPARVCREIAVGAGPAGIVGGQVWDLVHDVETGGAREVEYIHTHKTGALFRTSAKVGAVAAAAPERKIELASRFGAAVGLLFQVTDDILDETAATEALGKTAGKDAEQGKLTYPAVFGLDGARQEAGRLAGEASAVLEELASGDRMLEAFVDFVLNRTS